MNLIRLVIMTKTINLGFKLLISNDLNHKLIKQGLVSYYYLEINETSKDLNHHK